MAPLLKGARTVTVGGGGGGRGTQGGAAGGGVTKGGGGGKKGEALAHAGLARAAAPTSPRRRIRPSPGGRGGSSNAPAPKKKGSKPAKPTPSAPKTAAELDAEMEAYFRKADPKKAASRLDTDLDDYMKAKVKAKEGGGGEGA
jgi:hypothetical protein